MLGLKQNNNNAGSTTSAAGVSDHGGDFISRVKQQ
jgi:hypothetical protein